jgi:serine/threonine protein kinase
MDFVEGSNLSRLAKEGMLPAKRAAQYLKTIAGAVHYAHERGILHRDLKPSNILIDANDQPRVTDFGLAKQIATDTQLSTDQVQLTQTGHVLGSPGYMPPEQRRSITCSRAARRSAAVRSRRRSSRSKLRSPSRLACSIQACRSTWKPSA